MRKQRHRSADCKADLGLCLRYTDCTISQLFKSKSSFSVLVQFVLNLFENHIVGSLFVVIGALCPWPTDKVMLGQIITNHTVH